MKKRLRKKLRRGEFAEFGFEIVVGVPSELVGQDGRVDAALDELIAYVEGVALGVGGGFNLRGDLQGRFFVSALEGRKRKVTDADRDAMGAWLASRPWVASSRVGKLVDAWYGKWE